MEKGVIVGTNYDDDEDYDDNDDDDDELIACLGFYGVSTVFQLFIGGSSQINVSLTIFNHA